MHLIIDLINQNKNDILNFFSKGRIFQEGMTVDIFIENIRKNLNSHCLSSETKQLFDFLISDYIFNGQNNFEGKYEFEKYFLMEREKVIYTNINVTIINGHTNGDGGFFSDISELEKYARFQKINCKVIKTYTLESFDFCSLQKSDILFICCHGSKSDIKFNLKDNEELIILNENVNTSCIKYENTVFLFCEGENLLNYFEDNNPIGLHFAYTNLWNSLQQLIFGTTYLKAMKFYPSKTALELAWIFCYLSMHDYTFFSQINTGKPIIQLV